MSIMGMIITMMGEMELQLLPSLFTVELKKPWLRLKQWVEVVQWIVSWVGIYFLLNVISRMWLRTTIIRNNAVSLAQVHYVNPT